MILLIPAARISTVRESDRVWILGWSGLGSTRWAWMFKQYRMSGNTLLRWECLPFEVGEMPAEYIAGKVRFDLDGERLRYFDETWGVPRLIWEMMLPSPVLTGYVHEVLIRFVQSIGVFAKVRYIGVQMIFNSDNRERIRHVPGSLIPEAGKENEDVQV